MWKKTEGRKGRGVYQTFISFIYIEVGQKRVDSRS